jgi:hypothetical protein
MNPRLEIIAGLVVMLEGCNCKTSTSPKFRTADRPFPSMSHQSPLFVELQRIDTQNESTTVFVDFPAWRVSKAVTDGRLAQLQSRSREVAALGTTLAFGSQGSRYPLFHKSSAKEYRNKWVNTCCFPAGARKKKVRGVLWWAAGITPIHKNSPFPAFRHPCMSQLHAIVPSVLQVVSPRATDHRY